MARILSMFRPRPPASIVGYVVVDHRVGAGRGSGSGKLSCLDEFPSYREADRWIGHFHPTEAALPNSRRQVRIKGVIDLDSADDADPPRDG